jgi:D-alanyl-D-alanine carboxypeptidase (penicillin-binding protein 5/6)
MHLLKQLLLFIWIVPLFAEPLKVEVSAKAAILINAKTGAILFEKNAHQSSYPASITKVATALYFLEKKGSALDEIATAYPECLKTVAYALKFAPDVPPYCLEPDGTHMNIRSGENLALKTLFYGLLLASGNDAANVLAKHISGDIPTFIQDLNLYLQAKGFKETLFLNPHGLHHPDHMTTAYDMAFITKEALKYPFFREVVKTVRCTRPQTNKQPQSILTQGNRLVRPGQHYYSKALGVKTGHTLKAGFTLVGAAAHEERELIAVLLGCQDAPHRYQDAIRLFEAAFAQKPVERKLFAKGHDTFTCTLPGAKTALEAALSEDLIVTFFPAEEVAFKAKLVWDNTALPIPQGGVVGRLDLVTDEGKLLLSKPLLATYSVDKTLWKSWTDFARSHRNIILLTFLGLNVAAVLFYFLKKSQKVA